MSNPLKNMRVVLVRPQFGGNLGSICRSMKNMGLTDLAVVDPNPDMNFAEAQMMALHAVDVLENRQAFSSVRDAVADCALVAGTTARTGLYRAHAKTAREWAPTLLDSARANKVALLFGTEAHGLSNEDIEVCTQIIRIPSSPQYPSINLAQAVMICCYEMYVASGQFEMRQEPSDEAPIRMRERMMEIWKEMLFDIGFFESEKADHMMMGIRRIFARGKLTEADLNILMGIARQVQWYASECRKGIKPDSGKLPDLPV